MIKKFMQGRQFEDIGEVVKVIEAGEYIFLEQVPKHPRFMRFMVLDALIQAVKRGKLYMAVDYESPREPRD